MFDANQFLCCMATIPSTSAFLFGHERYLSQSLAQYLYTGRYVFVRDGKSEPLENDIFQIDSQTRAKVELVCGNEALLSFEGGASAKNQLNAEYFPLGHISLAESSLKTDDQIASIEQNRRELLSKKLLDFINLGDVFELQEKNSLNVHVVQILSNCSGFLEICDETGWREFVHITSPRCHPVGWTESQIQNDNNYKLYENTSVDKHANHVPPWLFHYMPLKEHKFWPGMLLEALDPDNRMMFYPAIVTERHNKHFFSIRLIRDLTSDGKLKHSPKIEMCHRSSADIFPMGWCSKNGLRLSVPKGLENFTYSNLWDGLRAKLLNLNIFVKEAPSYVTEDLLEFQKPTKKIHTMRYCEYQLDDDGKKPTFAPAVIVRSVKHLVWINVDNDAHFSAPLIFSTRSNKLFRWGFAAKAGCRLKFERVISRIGPCDLSAKFSSQRTTPFRNNRKNFLSNCWMNGNLWVPTVFVNRSCFCGPFLNQEKVKLLSNSYGPGPLPFVMSEIVKEITMCANRLTQLIDILQADKTSTLPTIQIHFKKNHRRHHFLIDACQQISEFPGWLRNFFIRMDACPNMISLQKLSGECPARCSQIAVLPFMQYDNHPNTYLVTAPFSRILMQQLENRRRHYNRLDSESERLDITLAEKTPVAAKRISSLENNKSEEEGLMTNDFVSINPSPSLKSRYAANFDEEMDIKPMLNSKFTLSNNSTEKITNNTINISLINNRTTLSKRRKLNANNPVNSSAKFGIDNRALDAKQEIVHENPYNNHPVHNQEKINKDQEDTQPLTPQSKTDQNGRNANTEQPCGSKWATTNSPPTPPCSKRIRLCHPPIKSNPMQWSCDELAEWIMSADASYENIARTLSVEEVDGEAIMMFKKSTLLDLGVKLGPTLKILALIEELKKAAVKILET